MSENLLHRIIRIPEDYGSVNIVALERNAGDLHLVLDVDQTKIPSLIYRKIRDLEESLRKMLEHLRENMTTRL
jgi:hypothetical protein